MVAEAFQNTKLHLRLINNTTGITTPPDSSIGIIPYKPSARDYDYTPNYPCAIETKGASGVMFGVEIEGEVDQVDVREWYLYDTDAGLKWFTGETEKNIKVNTIFTINEANSVAFFTEVVSFIGTGTVRIYASGDYID